MANFIYPAGTPLGTVPSNYVLPSSDYQTVIQQLFKAPNFTDGSTHAPSAFVTVGGSGFQLTGTGHTLDSAARLNVESTAEIRIKSGAELTIQSGGQATVEAGGLLQVDATGQIDVLNLASIVVRGTIRLEETSGPGVFIAENTTTSTWQSGSTATFNSGSTLNVSGDANLKSGSTTHLESGGNLYLDSGSFCQVSGALDLAGTTTFIGGTWPALYPARSWTRRSMTIALTTHNNGDTNGSPDAPDTWLETSDAANTPVLRTRTATASGQYTIVEFRNLPEGGTITQIDITSKGTGTTITQIPQYRIIRWQDGEHNYTNVSALTDDVHTTANFTSFSDTTTITPSSTTTIDHNYQYGLLILHPYDAGGCYARFYEVVMTGTATALKV